VRRPIIQAKIPSPQPSPRLDGERGAGDSVKLRLFPAGHARGKDCQGQRPDFFRTV